MKGKFFNSRKFHIFVGLVVAFIFFSNSIEKFLIDRFGAFLSEMNTGIGIWFVLGLLFLWYLYSFFNRLKREYFADSISQFYILLAISVYSYYRFFYEVWSFFPDGSWIKFLDILLVIGLLEVILGVGNIKRFILFIPEIKLLEFLQEQFAPLMIFLFYTWGVWYVSTTKSLILGTLSAICVGVFLFLLTKMSSSIGLVRKDNNLDEKKVRESLEYKGFIQDVPVNETNKDNLGFETYAENLAIKLLNTNPEKAFAIGINGEWGSGKTSFMNILKEKIKDNLGKESIIEVEFQPWNNHTPEGIISDFFDVFQTALAPYNSTLARSIRVYSNKLNAINNNKKTKYLQSLTHFFTGVVSLQDLHENINDTLKKINKKTFVFIDDLDRLDNEEIMAVLRLIRNTANFYNTFFVVAYSRAYLVRAIEQQNRYNKDRFLEKILQLEINLPYFSHKKITDALRNYLLIRTEIDFFPESKVIGGNYNGSYRIFDLEQLKTLRDVNRLVNGISLNIHNLNQEIYPRDLLSIEILRMKFPQIFNLLKDSRDDFLVKDNDRYRLRRISDKDIANFLDRMDLEQKKIRQEDGKEYLLRKYLRERKNSEIDTILNLVNFIFPDEGTDNLLSIQYVVNTNRYFHYSLVEGELSELEFQDALQLNVVDFQHAINSWLDNDVPSYRVFDRIQKIGETNDFQSQEEFSKVIQVLFYSGRRNYDTSIKILLMNFLEQAKRKQYENVTYSEEILKEEFEMAPIPPLFDADLLYNLKLSSSLDLGRDFENISQFYVEEYAKKIEAFDNTVIQLFFLSKNKTGKIPKKSKMIIQNLISKDLIGFLTYSVIPVYEGEYIVPSEGLAFAAYGGQKEFENTIINNKSLEGNETEEFKEFKEFYKIFKNSGGSSTLFTFNYLKVNTQ